MVFRNKGMWATKMKEGDTRNIFPKKQLRDQVYLLSVPYKVMLQKAFYNSLIFSAYSLNSWNVVDLAN